MTNSSLPTILNLIGLLLDIIGVVVLFYSTAKGLTKIQYPLLSHLKRVKIVSNEAQDLSVEMVKKINDSIDKSNKENELIFKKSKRWLLIIILGFIFQLSSSIITLCGNHPN